MTTMDLGAAMRKAPPDYGPLADLVAGMEATITDRVTRGVTDTVVRAILQALDGGITINPQVTVEAPAVTLSPNIQVDVPGEDDAGEIAATREQTMVLRAVLSELIALRTLLSQPVHRTVERGSGGEITGFTDGRA